MNASTNTSRFLQVRWWHLWTWSNNLTDKAMINAWTYMYKCLDPCAEARSRSVLVSVTAQKRACNTATCVTHRLADFLSRSGGMGSSSFVPTNVGAEAFGRRRRSSRLWAGYARAADALTCCVSRAREFLTVSSLFQSWWTHLQTQKPARACPAEISLSEQDWIWNMHLSTCVIHMYWQSF